MAEVGTVYVSVMPSTKGFAKALGATGGSGGAAAGTSFKNAFAKIAGGSAVGNIVAKGFEKVSSVVRGSLDAAIGRADTLNNFPKIMENLGYSTSEADRSIKSVMDHLQGLPTTSQEMVSFVKQLESTTGSLKTGTSLGLAFNDMLLAGGASSAEASNAMVQFNQMLAAGKVDMQSWQSVLVAAPKQLTQLAEKLMGAGKGQKDLYNALKDGKISMADFQSAIIDLAKNGGDGFVAWEKQAKTATGGIETSLNLVTTRVASAVQKVISHIGVGNISGVIDGFSSSFGGMADAVIAFWDGMTSSIDFAGFESAIGGLTDAVGSVFSGGADAQGWGEAVGGAVNGLIPAIQAATPVLQLLAQGLRFCADNAGWLVPLIIAVVVAIRLTSVAQQGASWIQAFTGALGASRPAASASAAEMVKVGAAALMIGAGIALAAAGMALLALTAIQLAQAGPAAAIALGALVLVIAGLAAGAALLGPALTAAAPGVLALGAAIALVGAGVLLASAGMLLLGAALPLVAASAPIAAPALTQIGAAALMATPGVLALGVGAIVLGAGLLVAGVGAAVLGAAMVLVGAGAILAGVGFSLIAASLPMVAQNAGAAAAGLGALVIPIGMVAGPAALAGGALMLCGAGVAIVAAMSVVAAIGLALMAAFLPIVAAAAPAAGEALSAFAASSNEAAAASSGALALYTALAAAMAMIATAALESAVGVAMTAAGIHSAANATGSLAQNAGAASANLAGAGASAMGCQATVAAASAGMAASGATMRASMQMVGTTTASAMRMAATSVRSAAATIASTRLTARVEFSVGRMPHFSMAGRFDAKTGQVPSIKVNWYAKGGIFGGPSVIGVGEGKDDEVVAPVPKLMDYIKEAVGEGGTQTGPTQEITIVLDYHAGEDGKKMTRDIARELERALRRG